MFEFLQSIADFFSLGIFQWFQDAAVYITGKLFIQYIEGKIWLLGFAWEVAQTVINQLGISNYLNLAFSGLSSDILNGITFFRVPEALNYMVSAGVTRMVLNFIGA